MCQVLFKEAISSSLQPSEASVSVASCSGEAAATPKDEITGPGPQSPKRQPDPKPGLLTLHCKYAVFSFHGVGSAFFKNLFCGLPKDLKYRAIYCQIRLPGPGEISPATAWSACLCTSGWRRVGSRLEEFCSQRSCFRWVCHEVHRLGAGA